MIETAAGFLLLIVGLGAVGLQRLYGSVPVRELKRLAVRGDQLATRLHRVAAYGASLRLLLWLIVGIALPLGFLLLIPALPRVVGFSVLCLAAILGFAFLPSLQLTRNTAHVAAWFAGGLTWVLSRTHTVLDRLVRWASHFRYTPEHSHLYEKEDLVELLSAQREQADNRIDEHDLELALRALTFSDSSAADMMQPDASTHMIDADEAIGPLLLDQLHKQKQNSFLVYKDNKETIIGSLLMSDAVQARHGGRVLDLVHSDLMYVHEDFNACQVLSAFHKTGHQLAVVVNNAEEFVGVILLEDLLEQLLGQMAQEDDWAYGDRSQVAAYTPMRYAEATMAGNTTGVNQTVPSQTASSDATEVLE